jgi:hypothetical protein
LEFFIISLSKSLNLKPRQAVALLANNRKFLIQISNRGIKGDFSKILNWYQELFSNYQTLLNLVNISSTKDAKSMTFATLTVGLFSKNNEIAKNAFEILCQLDKDMGMDYEWLFKDGLEILYFTIGKHAEIKQEILKFLEKMHREIPDKLSLELFNTRKLGTLKIYEFLGNIMDNIMEYSLNFLEIFRSKIPDFCFNEKTDLGLSISILGDYWIKIIKGKAVNKKNNNNKISELEKQREIIVINNILKFYKGVAREKNNKNLLFIIISQFFRLAKKLTELKDEYASQIYKILVFMFLENYNDNKIREVFLFNFIFLFNLDEKIPIEILLEPYLRQLKGTNNKTNIDVINVTNYDINDFKFLFGIISHPKLNLRNLRDIMEFCTLVSYTNLFFSRSANLLIVTILEKNLGEYNDLLNSKNLNQDIIDIYDVCISYIKNTLRIFLQNPKDFMILETPYNIANLNIDYIISAIESDVVDSMEVFRKNKGFFSQALLSLLWQYEKHDDVLLNLEEKYTEKSDRKIGYYSLINKNLSLNTEGAKEVRKLEFLIGGKPEKFLKFLKDKRERNKNEKGNMELQNILNNKLLIESIPNIVKKKILEENNIENISGILKMRNININNLNEEGVNKLKDIIKSSLYNNKLLKVPLITSSGAPSINPEVLSKIQSVFFDYENEGELREKEAIEALNKQYSRQLKQFFSFYVNEPDTTIGKNNILKMIRELGVDNDMVTIDDFNWLLRCTFGTPPKNINKSQLEIFLMQLGYVIYQKFKPLNTISMSYQDILKIICLWCKTNKLNPNKENLIAGKKSRMNSNSPNKNNSNEYVKYDFNKNLRSSGTERYSKDIEIEINNKKIYEYLKSKVEYSSSIQKTTEEITDLIPMNKNDKEKLHNKNKNNNKKNENNKEKQPENKTNFLMIPPGYTKKLMTEVQFEYSLPIDLLKKILPESKIICYEILSEILKKEFSSPIVEPYLNIYEDMKLLDESVEPKKNWGTELTIAFTKLDKKYEKVAIETTDLLEDILKAVSKGRENIDKPKYLTILEKNQEEEKIKKVKEKEDAERLRNLRKKELEKRLVELKYEKKTEEMAKEEILKKEKLEKGERMKSLTKAIEQKRLLMKSDVERKKKEKEKMKEENEKLEKLKKDEKEKIQEEQKKEFFKKQRRKLKEQFKEIREVKKDNYLKQQQDLISPKLPETNIQKIIEKDRDYIEFEKKLNENIEALLIRNDMKEFLALYEEHFKLIYDIYSNLGNKKIKFFSEKAIHFNEFKEFCSNFMIFGLLLTNDQINYIFKRISRRNEGTKDDLFFLRYNDFMVSIIYISICLKNSRRKDDRITQADLDKVNVSSLRNLIEYMGLSLPFNKKGLENFINDRRLMSAKQTLNYINTTKKKSVNIVKGQDSINASINDSGNLFSPVKKNTQNSYNNIKANEKEEEDRLRKLEDLRKREREKDIEENEKKNKLRKEEEEKRKLNEVNNLNNNYNNENRVKRNKSANKSLGKSTGKIIAVNSISSNNNDNNDGDIIPFKRNINNDKNPPNFAYRRK